MNSVSSPESTTESQGSRSARLSQATDALHEHLHTVVSAARPFESRERFGIWVAVQYRFQREIEPLYRLPALEQWLPELAARSRENAAVADLADLGVPVPEVEAGRLAGLTPVQALGWLFVSEGSTLGAAILFKKAQGLGLDENFGARHLAAAPEGRARHWKQFVSVVDTLDLSAEQELELQDAALSAFRRFDELLRSAYALG